MLIAAPFAWAQQAGQAPAHAPSPEQNNPADETPEEEVFVIAVQEDQTRIDRRVYAIGDNPIAQASTMLDILARVPSVTIAPSGAVRLLSAENVTIEVDGQPVPGQSLDAVLRSLSGVDIERIEVITNPSAQFSASAQGGVINIITKQKFRAGLTGATTAGADTMGGAQINLSPTWSRGAWSYGLRLGGNRGAWSNASTRVREAFDTGDVIRDTGDWESTNEGVYGGGVLTYRPDDARQASLTVWAWDFSSHSDLNEARSDQNGPVYTQPRTYDGDNSALQANFNFQQKGLSGADTLDFSASIRDLSSDFVDEAVQLPADNSTPLHYRSPSANDTTSASAKLDYERPLSNARMLNLGAALDYSSQQRFAGFETLAGPPIANDFESVLNGREETAALYATYQFDLGSWTMLPGLRGERYRRDVRFGGAEKDATDIDLFPSLHVRRKLSEKIDVDVSYSRRIARPPLDRLDPALQFVDAERANTGNPDLASTFTDAFEAKIVMQDSGRTYSATLFDRISTDIVSDFTQTTGGGVILTMPVNAGESEQRGLEVIARAPLPWRGWRYSVSANVLNRGFDTLVGGDLIRRDEWEYGGNAQIEYRDANQSEPGADQVQVEFQFQGPQHDLQGARDQYVIANATWRRRLSERISAVLSAQNIFDSAQRKQVLRTDAFLERYEREGAPPSVRLSLTYQFGDVRPGAPPENNAPPIGGPAQ